MPPEWLLKKWRHGRGVVQRRAEATRNLPTKQKRDDTKEGLSRGDLRDRELEGQDALRVLCNARNADSHHAQKIAQLRHLMEAVPGHTTEDLRVAVLSLRLSLDAHHVVLCESADAGVEHAQEVAPELAVPPFTDIAYYLTLRKFCESLWEVDGSLKLKAPGLPTKTMYKDAMAGLRFDSVQGSLSALAMRLCEVFSGSAVHGQYGYGRKRRQRRRLNTDAEMEESDDSEGMAPDLVSGSAVPSKGCSGLCGLGDPSHEQSALHREIFEDGLDWDAMLGDPAELAENKVLKLLGRTVVPLADAPAELWKDAELTRATIMSVLAEGPRAHPQKKQVQLDWSQRRPRAILRQWMEKGGRDQTVRPPRILLIGTAGSGKTSSIEAALEPVVEHAKTTPGSTSLPYAACAWNGVAAVNMGLGARTMSGLLGLSGGKVPEGAQFAALVQRFMGVHVLVIDEIGNVESDALALSSDVLDSVMRVVLQLPPCHQFNGGFGGLAVVLSGDLAQLPPVRRSGYLLADPELVGARRRRGVLLFHEFTDVVKLKRRYRQRMQSGREIQYAEMTVRMRDAALTVEDDQFLRGLSFETLSEEEQLAYQSEDTLWLSAENARVDNWNAQLLGMVATKRDEMVIEAAAHYPSLPGAGRSCHAFRSYVRHRFRCCRGAVVMLTVNKLWGVDVVPAGLMNGARGKVVGVMKIGAIDSGNLAFVVDFSSYTGQPFFPNIEGSATWVPVGVEEIPCEVDAKVVRAGYPLRLAYSVTGHKSQGLGVDRLGIDFTATHMKPAHLPGWPFTALTRAYSGDAVCVMGLPPLGDFVKMRDDKLFVWRSVWEERFDKLHDLFLQQQYGVENPVEHEVAMHWSEFKGSAKEWAEVETMLRHRGVAEPPPETYRHIAQDQTRSDVQSDRVRQADALAGHGKAMVRDGFRMGQMVLDTERVQQVAARHVAAFKQRQELQNLLQCSVADATKVLAGLTRKRRSLGMPVLQHTSTAPSVYAKTHNLVSPLDGFAACAKAVPGLEGRRWKAVEFGQWATQPGMPGGRGGLACMWLSLFAGFVQATRQHPALWEDCDKELREAVEEQAHAAQRDGIEASLRPNSALRQGAAALRRCVCAQMQTPRGLAQFGEFFVTDLVSDMVEGVSAEVARISRFVETIQAVERGEEMADHTFMFFAAQALAVRVLAIHWQPWARLPPTGWLVTEVNDGIANIDSSRTLVIGYLDLHFVPVLEMNP